MLRFHLKPFLERHRISAYQLARATKGKLSESTVYSLSREPQRRVDLNSVGVIVETLKELTGETVQIQDLIENVPEEKPLINPKYAYLLKDAKPATREQLEKVWWHWTPEELEEDDRFWNEYREEQRKLQEEREKRDSRDFE
jgi:primosomal protein N'